MPARSKVAQLPPEVREELDRRLVAGSFSGYVELAEWLTGQGFPISHAAVHRHGSQLERRIDAIKVATEEAEALVAAAPDDSGAVADAGLRLAQERIFQILLSSEEGNLKETASAARALAEMARAGTALRADRRKALADAADAAEAAAGKAGLSPDTAAAIRAAIEGAA